MIVVPQPQQANILPRKAQLMLDRLVYLSVSAAMSTQHIARIRQIIIDVDRQHPKPTRSSI